MHWKSLIAALEILLKCSSNAFSFSLPLLLLLLLKLFLMSQKVAYFACLIQIQQLD